MKSCSISFAQQEYLLAQRVLLESPPTQQLDRLPNKIMTGTHKLKFSQKLPNETCLA